jgi:8-oxo-dGTP diphosphatase
MMSKESLSNFNKRFDVVGCFIECDGKFLLLHRSPNKASGDCWGLPAGKVDDGEDIYQAMLREIKEETGIQLQQLDIIHSNSLFVREGDFDIMWHTFTAKLEVLPNVTIKEDEHSEYTWVTPTEASQMNLVHDLPELIEMQYPHHAIHK